MMAFAASRVPAPGGDLPPGADDGPARPGHAPCYALIAALMAAAPQADAPPDAVRLALGAAGALGRSDPVSSVQAAPLQSFDGALYRTGTGAWTILYGDRLPASHARFMIAYLLGRQLLGGPGLAFVECTAQALMAMPDDESAGGLAYSFAARLLMPLEACRRNLPGAVDLDALAALAQRFGLPLPHVARRWLSYTAQQAVLTLERDGRPLGTWTSETAFGLRACDLAGARQALEDGTGIALALGPRRAAVRASQQRHAAFPR
ncbi:ImmA/IrrE family metallo-endopeptidase [Cupriavidus sp. 30B13]|uniref:ImmA/IrrE family metallo-endopeptidase n=1 Tax=Cupriavidus sp. 30B13 TaxID=3384241 RepID=UPI003B8EDAD3